MATGLHKKCACYSLLGRTPASSSTSSCPLAAGFATLQTKMVAACRKDFGGCVCVLRPVSLFAFTGIRGVFTCFAGSFDLSSRD